MAQNQNKMDIKLETTSAEFINRVSEAVEYYGADGIWHDQFYTVIGAFTEKAVNNFIDEYTEDINNVIDFASTWDIDPNEWELTDPADRFKFAAGYIASQIESEKEFATA